jgi:hypothetical protein
MKPKPSVTSVQPDFFQTELKSIINLQHPRATYPSKNLQPTDFSQFQIRVSENMNGALVDSSLQFARNSSSGQVSEPCRVSLWGI